MLNNKNFIYSRVFDLYRNSTRNYLRDTVYTMIPGVISSHYDNYHHHYHHHHVLPVKGYDKKLNIHKLLCQQIVHTMITTSVYGGGSRASIVRRGPVGPN